MKAEPRKWKEIQTANTIYSWLQHLQTASASMDQWCKFGSSPHLQCILQHPYLYDVNNCLHCKLYRMFPNQREFNESESPSLLFFCLFTSDFPTAHPSYWLCTFFPKGITPWMSMSLLNSGVGLLVLKVNITREPLGGAGLWICFFLPEI